MNMADKSKAGFAERQLARAKKACNCQGIMAHPSIQDHKQAVCSNEIKDCPIAETDMKMMQNVYGPNIAKVKGSQVRIKPVPVMENCILLPKNALKAQKCVTLTADMLLSMRCHFYSPAAGNCAFLHASL